MGAEATQVTQAAELEVSEILEKLTWMHVPF